MIWTSVISQVRVNPADTLTRQVHGSDEQYAGEVRKADADWMQNVRVTEDATDSADSKEVAAVVY